MTIHGTLDEQLGRCNREIAGCEAYLSNPDNPDRFGAELGLLDWLVNRQDVLAELAGEPSRRKLNTPLATNEIATRNPWLQSPAK